MVLFRYANPPSSEQLEREQKLESAREKYEQQTQVYQQHIQQDTSESQWYAQRAQEDADELSRVTQKLKQDTQDLQRNVAQVQQDKEMIEQDKERLQEIRDQMWQVGWEENEALQQYTEQRLEADYTPTEADYDAVVAPFEEELDQLRDDYQTVEDQMGDPEREIRTLDWETDPLLQQDIDNDQRGVSMLQEQIQIDQDMQAQTQTEMAEDIAQQQTNLDAAERDYESAVQEANAPDPQPTQPDGSGQQTSSPMSLLSHPLLLSHLTCRIHIADSGTE